MKWKEIKGGTQRTFAVIFDKDDEVVGGLTGFAREQRLGASQITAIGAFSRAKLGYFDWDRKEYKPIPVDEQVEVVSLIGDIARDAEDQPTLHAHVVLGRRDGTALGGHLLEARVRPTLEVIVTESPEHLRKAHDAESGLALIAV